MQSFFTWSKMVNHGIIRILTNETGRITDRYGYDAYGIFIRSGNKVSIHYFRSQSGRVFDVKVKQGWSS